MLRIGQGLVDEIIAHARRDHPDEACGVIAGPAGSDRPERFIPMLNAARSPTFYEFESGDLLALYGMQLDTWIDPETRDDELPTYKDPDRGGQPRVLGGKGIGYQKRLPGDFEVDGWNTIEIIVKGDTTTHVLNGHVVNRGKNIRFTDPENPIPALPLTRGRIALEIEAAEIEFRKVEIKSLGDESGPGK